MMNDNDTFSLKEPMIEEDLPLLDEATVEKQLTEEFVEMQKNMPAQDVAAQFFKMFFPQYLMLLSVLSNKDARRVAEHVVQWPLEDQYPKFGTEKAKQAFQVGIRLMDCKMIMRTYVEMERMKELEEARQKQESSKTNEQVDSGNNATEGTN